MNLQTFVITSSIRSLCSDEQIKLWLPKVEKYEMIVSYAQTELGHGSNVANLQTEAVYIKETDEFDIHSPTIESTKWWIGQLGKCANYCIVFAQLIIDGKRYGPHPFMVQIRCLESHKPLKGITVGDIGPKFGFNAADNGFIRFDHVRIPRKNILSRFFEVSREGKYIPPPNPKLVYGSMLAVRVRMTEKSSSPLRLAATIAVRYSAVRRQFSPKKGEKELQILDYQSQQYRILPVLATTYAALFTGEWMAKLYDKLQNDISNGDFSLLSTVHASSAGLKSLLTTIVSNGIETCRLACGGHGYSQYSGLPNLYATYVHMATAEGENLILTQQTTRYLLNVYRKVASNNGSIRNEDPAKYLEIYTPDYLSKDRCNVNESSDWLKDDIQLRAFQHRSARWVTIVARNIQENLARGIKPHEAWNNSLIEIQRASQAHCYTIIAKTFIDKVLAIKKENPKLYPVLKSLCDLFNLYNLEKDIGELTEDGYLSYKQSMMLRNEMKQLLVQVRKNAVPLVDAFNIPDFTLCSALGRYDGNVYQEMYEWSQKEPLNQEIVSSGFIKYINPLMQRSKL